MEEYIRRKDVINLLRTRIYEEGGKNLSAKVLFFITCITDWEPVDVVPRSAYEQIEWERDIAIKQLKEHKLTLGEKSRMIECFCGECENYVPYKNNKESGFCKYLFMYTLSDGYCYYGEKRGENYEATNL